MFKKVECDYILKQGILMLQCIFFLSSYSKASFSLIFDDVSCYLQRRYIKVSCYPSYRPLTGNRESSKFWKVGKKKNPS